MCIITCDDKSFHLFNTYTMVNDLFFKHENQGIEGHACKQSHLHPKFVS
jgi:hypothetical protein